MKKLLTCLFFAALLPALPAAAQTRSHKRYSNLFDTFYYRGPMRIIGGPGIAIYSGDLCNTWECNKLRAGFGLGVVSPFFPRISIGAEARYFHLASSDIFSERNNTFKSKNWEFTGFGRVHILNQLPRGPHNKPRRFDPFVSLGVGLLKYNPVSFNADGTENIPESDYPGYAPLVPFGVGTSVRIFDFLGLEADLNYRYAFSDYLDDTSTLRGKDSNKDGYILFNLKASFTPNPMGLKSKNPYK